MSMANDIAHLLRSFAEAAEIEMLTHGAGTKDEADMGGMSARLFEAADEIDRLKAAASQARLDALEEAAAAVESRQAPDGRALWVAHSLYDNMRAYAAATIRALKHGAQ
jgi:hypothetical protein